MGVHAKLLLGAPTALTVKPAWHTVLHNANATSTTAPARAISVEAHASTHPSTNASTRHVHERTHMQHARYACAHTHSDGVRIVAELARPCSGRIDRIIAGHAAAVRSFLAALCSEPSHAGIFPRKRESALQSLGDRSRSGQNRERGLRKRALQTCCFPAALRCTLLPSPLLKAAGLYRMKHPAAEPRTKVVVRSTANCKGVRSGQAPALKADPSEARKDEIETKQQ